MPYLYHVTPKKRTKRILKEGLKCLRGTGLTTKSFYRKRVYFFTTRKLAETFLADMSEWGLTEDYVILKVWVPATSRLYRDVEMRGDPEEEESVYVLGTVSPKDIKVEGTLLKALLNVSDTPYIFPGLISKSETKRLVEKFKENPDNFEEEYDKFSAIGSPSYIP